MSARDNEKDRWARVEWPNVHGWCARVFVGPPGVWTSGAPDCDPLKLPVLFVHGLGCSGETWEPTLRELCRRSRCGAPRLYLAPDMPGYGRSEGPPEALGMDELADWLAQLLDIWRIPRVHVVGNSMGCQVNLAFARRHPSRVGGMVLQGPTTGERVVPAWRYVAGLLADTFHENPAYTLRLLKMYGQMGPVRYTRTVARMLEDDPFATISAVRAPTLVIRGGNDAIVSERVARHLVVVLPDAVYMPLDSAAHAIEYNDPVPFVDAVLTFLSREEQCLDLAA